MEKLKARSRAEKIELETLGDIAAEHAESLSAAQRRLESNDRRHKAVGLGL